MKAVIVQGLFLGDEGKGSIVDALVRQTDARLVVRFNGGAQAAHHVVADVRGTRVTHCHAQTGAGTLAGADTFLSRFVMVDPISLANEVLALPVTVRAGQIAVDPEAPILTPWHKAVNRLRELSRGDARHGSCGMGIGELGEDLAEGRTVLRMKDLYPTRPRSETFDKAALVHAVKQLQAKALSVPPTDDAARHWLLLQTDPHKWLEQAYHACGVAMLGLRTFADAVHGHETVVFEGAQGVLLDETHGFQPHVTWSNCTFENALALCQAHGIADVTKIGVVRAFATRHGAGPFPTEVMAGCAARAPRGWTVGEHNTTGPWQGYFRYGYFDAALARYALRVVDGVDALAVTCVDRWPDNEPFMYAAWHYNIDAVGANDAVGRDAQPAYVTAPTAIAGIERALDRPVDIISAGPTAAGKVFRTQGVLVP